MEITRTTAQEWQQADNAMVAKLAARLLGDPPPSCFTADTYVQSGIIATDNTFDPECLPLCEALAAIPDIDIVAACNGHGTAPLRVWFTAGRWDMEGVAPARHDLLWPVLTACALTEQAGAQWSCICVVDCRQTPRLWCLTSLVRGMDAVEDARRLARTIRLLQEQRGTFPDV